MIRSILLVVITISSLAAAQSASLLETHAPASPITNTDDAAVLTTLHKDVNEVTLFFTANDGHGRFVNDLALPEIELRDKRVAPQAIHTFEVMSNVPVRCTLLIDTSDSISQKFAFEKAAASEFLRVAIRPGTDKAIVIGFNESMRIAQDWTDDSSKLRSALQGLREGGSTAFYDALVYAAAYLQKQDENTRRIIVVISDGQDNASHAGEARAIDAVLGAQATVYAINTGQTVDPSSRGGWELQRAAQKTLSSIVDASGGRLLPGDNSKLLGTAFQRIAEELRKQYLVAYTPADFIPDGQFRKIEIRTNRRGVRLRARRGYYSH